jgi:arginase family enzyme
MVLSYESLETGTGSSNSLRSANESVRTDTGSGVISWAQRKPGYRKGPRALRRASVDQVDRIAGCEQKMTWCFGYVLTKGPLLLIRALNNLAFA